jgi:alpha-mannosidase
VRGADVESTTPLALGRWQMLTATYDGQILRLYQDGRQIGWTETALTDDEAVVRLRPLDPWDKERRFAGDIRGFTIWSGVLPGDMLELLNAVGAEQ